MTDPTHRATRRNLSTQPIQRTPPRLPRIRGDVKIGPAELALALEWARAERIERDIAAYTIRKRTT